jgi:hypothetical protein
MSITITGGITIVGGGFTIQYPTLYFMGLLSSATADTGTGITVDPSDPNTFYITGVGTARFGLAAASYG